MRLVKKIVYRPAFVWFLVGVGLTASGLASLARGIGVLISGEQYQTAPGLLQFPHWSRRSEVALDLAAHLVLVAAGLLFLVILLASSVTLDQEGVVVKGFGRGAGYRFSYQEAEGFCQRKTAGGSVHVLQFAGQTRDFPAIYPHQDQIMLEIQNRALVTAISPP